MMRPAAAAACSATSRGMFFMAAHPTMRPPRVYGKPVTSHEGFRHCPRNGKWQHARQEVTGDTVAPPGAPTASREGVETIATSPETGPGPHVQRLRGRRQG